MTPEEFLDQQNKLREQAGNDELLTWEISKLESLERGRIAYNGMVYGDLARQFIQANGEEVTDARWRQVVEEMAAAAGEAGHHDDD